MEQYNVTGMSCAACSTRVEKAVLSVEGVTSCSVSLLTNSMGVSGSASPNEIIKAVTEAGYGASLKAGKSQVCANDYEEQLVDRESPAIRKRLIISIILMIPLMYVSMGTMLWNVPLPKFLYGNHIAMGIYQLVLSGLVMVVNQKFFINGFKSIYHRAPNMDTLVALGSSASFVYSLYALFAMSYHMHLGDMEKMASYMDEFYFESAAMILTLITVGKLLEAKSKGKTTDALKSLMKMAPKTAVIVVDGVEKEVSIDEVKTGDIFVVKPGEAIAVDGIVIEGISAVNEAALTGESIPVDKNIGDEVSSGTVNTSGYLLCKAARVGEDTTLSQIIQMVSDAAATKAPIAKIADKVSGIFVPAVIGLAALTFVIWILAGESFGFCLARAISVLVISCPCALGLATPVAIMVGNGMSAKHGILFKTSEALEEAGKVQIVCLDKTGTITRGEPKVKKIVPREGYTEEDLLMLAYSLELKSEHPLAKAVAFEGEKRCLAPLKVDDFKAMAGNGLIGKIDGEEILGGKYDYINSKFKIDENTKILSEKLSEDGLTPLFFAYKGKYIGMIAVSDVIKEDSPEAINQLKKMGIHVVMITGDNQKTANAIGREAMVDEVISGVMPDGKKEIINRLKTYGKVAMVGDGINDAPALTTADIGIAIGAGTDVAIDAADIVLMKSSLMDLAGAIRMSRATIKNVKENLFWAFFYNVIGIPLAAGFWIPIFGWTLNPMFGAAAMGLSSFCVVTNALRLNLFSIMDCKKDSPLKNSLGHDSLLTLGSNESLEEDDLNNTNNKDLNEKETNKMKVKVNGMMCKNCEAHVKKAIEAIDGVSLATASHEENSVEIETTKEVSLEEIKKVVEEEGYEFVG